MIRPSTLRPAAPLPRESALRSIQSLLSLTVVALFTVTFLFQPSRIPSASMSPTLRIGDFLLVDKQAFSPAGFGRWSRWGGVLLPRSGVQRGDVVVFHYPLHPETPMVKRVVGVAGDRIHLRAGRVFVNGAPVNEPYATFTPSGPDAFRDDFPALHRLNEDVEPAWWVSLRRNASHGDLLVPAGDCFVLGDNRNDSLDSRYWGFVPDASIEGRPLAVLLSANAPAPGQTFAGRLGHLLTSERLVQ